MKRILEQVRYLVLIAIVQLIVFIGVKGVERLVAVREPIDALTYTGAVAILIAALSLFRLKPSRYEPPPHRAPAIETQGGSPGESPTLVLHASDEVSGPNTSAI